jgi:hypothetical protein
LLTGRKGTPELTSQLKFLFAPEQQNVVYKNGHGNISVFLLEFGLWAWMSGK